MLLCYFMVISPEVEKVFHNKSNITSDVTKFILPAAERPKEPVMKWEKSLSLERSVVYLWVAVLFISDGLA